MTYAPPNGIQTVEYVGTSTTIVLEVQKCTESFQSAHTRTWISITIGIQAVGWVGAPTTINLCVIRSVRTLATMCKSVLGVLSV